MQLNKEDLRNVVLHLPKDIRKILTTYPGKTFVGGGFIRAVVGNETISDIDMFGHDKDKLDLIASKLTLSRQTNNERTKQHNTKNAITILTEGRLPVQFITRWLFDNAEELTKSFDFTVCQAVVWYENGEYRSMTNERFYSDLAAKRLHYTAPNRAEDAGGSMLRVMKYVKRGYSISPESLGKVMARVSYSIDTHELATTITTEQEWAKYTQAKLREVDPLLVVDGLDIVDDHEKPEEETKVHPNYDPRGFQF